MARQTLAERAIEFRQLQPQLRAAATEGDHAFVANEGGALAKAALVGFCPMPGETSPFDVPATRVEREVLARCGAPESLLLLTYLVRQRPGGGQEVLAAVKHWLPWLFRELQAAQPPAVLLLGVHAAQAVLQLGEPDIERLRHVRFVLARTLPDSNIFVTYAPDQIYAEGGLDSNLGHQWCFDHTAVFKGQHFGSERSYFHTTRTLET